MDSDTYLIVGGPADGRGLYFKGGIPLPRCGIASWVCGKLYLARPVMDGDAREGNIFVRVGDHYEPEGDGGRT